MHRWSDRNLTRLELVMALLIMFILIGAFSRHVLIVFARAESTMINTTVMNMNTTLQYYAMNAALKGDVEKLAALGDPNLLTEVRGHIGQAQEDIYKDAYKEKDSRYVQQLLTHDWLPGNYIGELEAPNPEEIGKGKWYFDKSEGLLIYRVSNSEFFHSELNGAPRIRFKIYFDYEDVNLDGIYNPDQDVFRSITLKSPDNYEWLIKQ